MLSLRGKGYRERSGRGKGSVFRLFEELLTLRLCACRFEGHPLFFFLVVHPACWGRSQLLGLTGYAQRVITGSALRHEMLS